MNFSNFCIAGDETDGLASRWGSKRVARPE
jgi:hypothetical protein